MQSIDKPGIYSILDIYDPDTNPEGTIIPAVKSFVIDMTNEGRTYYVAEVDPITYKPTLKYLKTSLASYEKNIFDNFDITSIINYGNTRFYAFFDLKTKPTKITIDKKLVIFGKNNKYYRLIKISPTNPNEYSVISAGYSSTGDYTGEFIPLVATDNNNYIKYASDCYTSYNLEDNDLITMEIYDINKTLTYSLTLFPKKITSIAFVTEERKIVGFELECTQEIDNDTFYIYPQQNPDSLVLTPKLILNDGQITPTEIDNTKCFLYGLDDFVPAFPGQETSLLCKYYLSQNEVADPHISTNNMLVCEKTLKVINNESDTYTLKISVIPRFDYINSKYVLFFYAYIVSNNIVKDVTPFITILSQGFDFRYYDGYQQLQYQLNLKDIFPNLPSSEFHIQSCQIKLAPISYYEKYIIRDSTSDEYGIYGVEGGNRHRPVIYSDVDNNRYFISQNLFPDTTKFLDEFYFRARPVILPENTNPITPTHFTIRDIITNNLLLSDPIPVEDYMRYFTLLTSAPITNTNVIVEMLELVDTKYNILYGTPVDVVTFT